MKFRSILASASAAALVAAAAGAANAAIVIDHTVANQLYGLDTGVMLKDFDSVSNPNVLFTGNVVLIAQNPVSTSAPPPYVGAGSIPICCENGSNYSADPTHFASVQAGGTSTFSVLGGGYLTSFSFYMGSPDTYNHVTFNLAGGGSQVFDGASIWGNVAPADGNRQVGYRVYYNFNGAKVSSVTFASDSDAFEFDGLAGAVAGVPEPASWALMIMGFGAIGAALRSRRRVVFA